MVQALLFDVDGTLIDSVDQHAEAWKRGFAAFGYDIPFNEVRAQIGKGGDQLLPVFLDEAALARDGAAIERYRSDLFRREYMPHLRPFPEVQALVRRAREAGLRVALASSSKAEEVAEYARLAGIADLIEAATSTDDAAHSKPAPDIFEAALARIPPVTAAEAIAVGDSPHDAAAAGRAGLRVIGLLCGGFAEADLRRAGCMAIYRDPADLLRRYDSSPLALA